jgi:hypothetical protein
MEYSGHPILRDAWFGPDNIDLGEMTFAEAREESRYFEVLEDRWESDGTSFGIQTLPPVPFGYYRVVEVWGWLEFTPHPENYGVSGGSWGDGGGDW